MELDNVLLTPHNAALTLECRKRMAVETCQNILYYLNDHAKLNKNNIVNRLKNKSQMLSVSENVSFLFNIFIDNNVIKILCCLPSISINIKDIVELLK